MTRTASRTQRPDLACFVLREGKVELVPAGEKPRRGETAARVLVDQNRGRVEVLYRDRERVPHKKILPDTKAGRREAVAWARAYLEELAALGTTRTVLAPQTVRDLWDAYWLSERDNLRPKTRIAYQQRWAKWERFIGAQAIANDTTIFDIKRFRAAATEAGMVLNQIRQVLNVARVVYNWGQLHRRITQNDFAIFRWKQAKDAPVTEPEEYTPAEYDAILRTFDPSNPRQWRPWVALLLAGESGQRANAVLHLKWADIDWAAMEIVWPAAYQKQGKALRRPITWPILSALLTARLWRERECRRPVGARVRLPNGSFGHDPAVAEEVIETPWVLFALNTKTNPYSYSSLHYQLTQAEIRGKVDHKPYRAVHGKRRMVVGNIIERTGDRMLGLEYVGDSDPKQLKSYDRRAEKRAKEAAKALEETR